MTVPKIEYPLISGVRYDLASIEFSVDGAPLSLGLLDAPRTVCEPITLGRTLGSFQAMGTFTIHRRAWRALERAMGLSARYARDRSTSPKRGSQRWWTAHGSRRLKAATGRDGPFHFLPDGVLVEHQP